MKKQISSKLNIAEKMPPLYHSIPGQNFDIKNSEVVKWLIEQPEILQYLFDKISHNYLQYDSATGKWKGIDNCD